MATWTPRVPNLRRFDRETLLNIWINLGNWLCERQQSETDYPNGRPRLSPKFKVVLRMDRAIEAEMGRRE